LEVKNKMPFSITTKQIIDYPSTQLETFYQYTYEWIDNLNFALNPEDCLENADDYIEIATKIFLKMGWDGDGKIQLLWIPPFVFSGVRDSEFTKGLTIWHVKQNADGISWILSPKEFIFDDFVN
jgi:hypothetical protein